MTDAPLRYLKTWYAVGVLLIGFVVYLSLAPSPFELPFELPFGDGNKYGHFLAYAALMFWFAQIHPAQRARLGWALAFAAMGIGLEFLQRLTDYRMFDVSDMAANGVGVCVGWLAAPPRSPPLLRWIEAH